jgi:hypothetical protein
MFNISQDWTEPSAFSFTQGEAHDYIGSRLSRSMTKVTSYNDFLTSIEKETSPESFLIISKEAVEAVETYPTALNPLVTDGYAVPAGTNGFRIEFNDGDEYSGRAVYKSKTVGGVEFTSSINCLIFDSPGEPIAFIATVKDFKANSGTNKLSLQTLQGQWDETEGIKDLVKSSEVILNDINGRAFLFNSVATFLLFKALPVNPETAPEA